MVDDGSCPAVLDGDHPTDQILGATSTPLKFPKELLDLIPGIESARLGIDIDVEDADVPEDFQPRGKTKIGSKIDTVLRGLRATSPAPNSEKYALTVLLAALG